MKVGFFGAGAIGGYVGVRLSAGGTPVVLVGRRSLVDDAPRLEAADLDGRFVRPRPDLEVTERAEALSDVDVCFVTVKAADTKDAGACLQEILRPDAVVVSLQNGLQNVERLRTSGLTREVLPAMVTFNVVRDGPRFAKATSGPLMVSTHPRMAALLRSFSEAKEPLSLRRDMRAVQVGKLLLNLNNGVCAATGLPIVASLGDPDGRWLFSECIVEGLRVMRAANERIASIGILSPPLIARALRLPTPVFTRVARRMMTIDPAARSSTLQDLDRGRTTEIDDLNGEIARRAGRDRAPVNTLITEVVHAIEREQGPHLSASTLRKRLFAT